MHFDKTTRRRRIGALGNAFLGGLMVTLPAIAATFASAQTAAAQTPAINPCPRIYYEEPFNSDRRVPEGCPPNAATLQETGQDPATAVPAPLPSPIAPGTSTAPGSPSGFIQPPSAFVTPANGTVTVELINNTGTDVTFEVIGETDQRSIAGRSQVTLQELQVPINMTFVRPDGGFVTVTPQQTAPGILQVTLVEAPNVDASQGALNIQPNGNVYLN